MHLLYDNYDRTGSAVHFFLEDTKCGQGECSCGLFFRPSLKNLESQLIMVRQKQEATFKNGYNN